VLQRTPNELNVPVSAGADSPQWVGGLTLGYSRKLMSLWTFDFLAGVAGTLDFLPEDYQAAYGGPVVAVGRMFFEMRFANMWSLGGHVSW
jgi:hypothetical protein